MAWKRSSSSNPTRSTKTFHRLTVSGPPEISRAGVQPESKMDAAILPRCVWAFPAPVCTESTDLISSGPSPPIKTRHSRHLGSKPLIQLGWPMSGSPNYPTSNPTKANQKPDKTIG